MSRVMGIDGIYLGNWRKPDTDHRGAADGGDGPGCQDHVLKRMKNPELPMRESIFEPQLIVRASTGPIAGSARPIIPSAPACSRVQPASAAPSRLRLPMPRCGASHSSGPAPSGIATFAALRCVAGGATWVYRCALPYCAGWHPTRASTHDARSIGAGMGSVAILARSCVPSNAMRWMGTHLATPTLIHQSRH